MRKRHLLSLTASLWCGLIGLHLNAFAQNAPIFTSTPVTTATENVPYTYSITASDVDQDPLTISSITLPSWLSMVQGQSSGTAIGPKTTNAYGIASDESGNIYVADGNGPNIYKITPSGVRTIWASKYASGYTYGMAINGNYLYVGNYLNQNQIGITRIRLDNPAAGHEIVLNSSTITAGMAMIFKDNYLYFTSYILNKIGRINLSNLQAEEYITSGLPTGGPWGLGFNNAGDIYVSTWNNRTILKYAAGTTTNPTIALTSAQLPSGSVSDVKIDKNGYVYVSFVGSGIRRYSNDLSTFITITNTGNIWGMALSSSGTLSYIDAIDGQAYKLETGAVLTGTPTHADVGVHPVKVKVTDGTNNVEQSFNITVVDPNPPTVTAYSPLNNATNIETDANLILTFNETVHKGTGFITIKNSANNTTVEQIDVNSSNVTIADKVVTINPTGNIPHSGTYYVLIDATAIKDNSDNAYAGIANNTTFKFSTVPVKLDQTITLATTGTATYGDADLDLAATSNNATIPVTLSSGNTSIATLVGGKVHILKAGTVNITASQAGNGTYNPATDKVQTLTINPKSITLDLLATPAITKTYDGTTGIALAVANYKLNNLVGSDAVAVTGTTNFDNKNAGLNKIVTATTFVLSGAQKDNYTLSTTSTTTTGSITAKSITVTPNAGQSRVYGAADPTYTYSITTGGALITGDVFTGVLTRAAGGTVATNYAIGQGTLSAGNNYNISFIPANFAITKADLTITAENKEKFAGTADPTFTARYTGFIAGENNTFLTTQPEFTTTANLSSPIGTYDINVAGAAAANYNISYAKGILTIKPGAPTNITLAAVPLFENRPIGTNAGTLSSTSDDPSATFSYTLVAGAGDTDNALFTISTNKVNTNAILDYETKANYSIRVRSTTQYGQSLDKIIAIAIIDVNEAPTLAAINNQNICYTTATQAITLTGISAGPETTQTTTLSVSSNNAGLFESLTVTGTGATGILNYKAKTGTSGTATVTVTVKDNGGTANGGIDTYSRTFVITINALPVVSINSEKGAQISKGEKVLLSATGGAIYQWAPNNSIQNGQSTATIEVRPKETTTYTVTVTNASGCTETKSFTLTVLDDLVKINANNILSPNGDGYNDKWVIDNIDMYPNNEVKVFDKSGRFIYGKKGYDNSWEGTLNGAPLAEGTYYYIIDFGTDRRVFKGYITVTRSEQSR